MNDIVSKFAKSAPLVGLVGFVTLLALLEICIRYQLILPTIIALPSDAVTTVFTLQRKVDLFGGFILTLKMTAIAMASAVAVAIPVGYFLYRRAIYAFAFVGWLAALFAAPVFLLYPLFMVIFGRGELTLILMGFIPGVIPIIIQTWQGLNGVDQRRPIRTASRSK